MPDDISDLVKDTEKVHGPGVAMRGSTKAIANHIPTGVFILDFALLGGIAQGYIGMVYGYHSCGKSTRILRMAAEFQRKHPDKWVGWIDAEGMYDPKWAEMNGLDTSRVIVSQPEYGELAVDLFESMLKRPSIGFIVIDSIPSVVPMKVIENSAEDDTMAASARLMGKLCSKVTMGNNAERKKGHWVTVMLVNQFRNKVGFVLGDPRVLPGGIQLNHVPTTKIEFKKGKTIMGKDRYGSEVAEMDECSFKLEKVKHGQSIRTGDFQMYLNPDNEAGFDAGEVDNYSTIVTFAKRMGYITGGGSAFRLLTEDLDKKTEAAVAALKLKEPDVSKEKVEKLEAAIDFTKFAGLEPVKAFLRKNEEEYETLARSLIATQRIAKGLPALPPDGYLVGPGGRLVLPHQLPSASGSDE
jgi:protein RecA